MLSDNDVNEKWNELFTVLVRTAQITRYEDIEIAQLAPLLTSLGLIQPFNWNAWGQPVPAPHEMWQLSIFDCIRHITRFVRADRFNEGVLHGAVRSGALPILCMVAFQRTSGQTAPALEDLEDVVAN